MTLAYFAFERISDKRIFKTPYNGNTAHSFAVLQSVGYVTERGRSLFTTPSQLRIDHDNHENTTLRFTIMILFSRHWHFFFLQRRSTVSTLGPESYTWRGPWRGLAGVYQQAPKEFKELFGNDPRIVYEVLQEVPANSTPLWRAHSSTPELQQQPLCVDICTVKKIDRQKSTILCMSEIRDKRNSVIAFQDSGR